MEICTTFIQKLILVTSFHPPPLKIFEKELKTGKEKRGKREEKKKKGKRGEKSREKLKKEGKYPFLFPCLI